MRLKTLGIEGSENLELIKAVTLKMKDADLDAALAKTRLNKESIKGILSSHGVAEANLDETAQKILNTRATEANAKATTKMATAQGSLKSAIIGVRNAIKAHPYIAAAVGVAAAAALIVTAVATFTKNTDELIEENNNLKASMEETKTKISDSKTQIEEINTEINTLMSQGGISLTTQEEINKLKQQKELLQQTVELQREQLELDTQKAEDNAKKIIESTKTDSLFSGAAYSDSTEEKMGFWDRFINFFGRGQAFNDVTNAPFGADVSAQSEYLEDTAQYSAKDYITHIQDRINSDTDLASDKNLANIRSNLLDISKTYQEISDNEDLYGTGVANSARIQIEKILDLLNKINLLDIDYGEGFSNINTLVRNSLGDGYYDQIESWIQKSATEDGLTTEDIESDLGADEYKKFAKTLEENGYSVNQFISAISASEQAAQAAAEAINEASDQVATLSDTMESLNNLAGGIKSLDTAFEEMKENGKVSFDTLSDIQSAFADVDGIDDYIKKLADADTSTEEFNKILSDLVYAKIQQTYTDEQIVASGEDVIRTLLESNGVSNAAAVATDIVSNAKRNLAAQNYDITNVSRESLEAEAKALGLTKEQFALLLAQQQVFNNSSLSVANKIEQLKALAQAAGATAAAVSSIGSGVSTNSEGNLDPRAGSAISSQYGSVNNYLNSQFSDALKTNTSSIDAEFDAISFSGGSGSSGSGGSGGSGSSSKDAEETAETFDWIEVKISRVERVIARLKDKVSDTFSSWGKRNRALSREINTVTKEINLQEKAADKYQKKANSVGLSSKWREKVQNGSLNIDEVKSDTLKEKIKDYQEWYEKVLDCKDSIQDLKTTLNELNQEKFDNWMERFDNSLQQRIHDNELLESSISRRNANANSANTIDYSTAVAKANIADYQSIIANNDAMIAKRRAEIKKLQQIQKSTPKGTQAWYDQQDEINNLQNEINDLKEDSIDASSEIAQAYVTMFDNIGAKFDATLSEIEHRSNLLEEQINREELKGHMISESFYGLQSIINDQELVALQQQLTQQQQALNDAVASGSVKVGSEDWKDMVSEINATAEGIEECKTETIELNNAIRELNWELFDMFQDKISDIASESEFLIDLLSRKDLFDDNGKITDEGMATMGLRVTNMETYSRQAREYANELAKLDAEYANDSLNTDYLERRQELIELQQDAIKNIADEKEAIVDLVEEGIEAELDALQELIDKYKDVLQSEKDLYDYQKNVRDQTKEIASLEKQLAAYSGDTSEETQAKIQEIKVSLEEAREDLRETEYDQYISDQEKLLDDLYDEYEEVLNSRLDDVSILIQGVIDSTNINAENIATTIRNLAGAEGYSLQSIGNILSGGAEGNILTAVNNVIDAINKFIGTLPSASNTKNIPDGGGYAGSSMTMSDMPTDDGNNASQPASTQGNGQIDIGDTVEFVDTKGKRHYYEDSKGNGRKELTSNNSSSFIIKRINNGAKYPYYLENKNGVKLGWVNASQIKGYASGIKNLRDNQLAWTQENAREFIIRKSDGAVLTPLMRGDSVLNSTASENLWKLANSPYDYLKDNIDKLRGSISPVNNGGSFNGTVENHFTITLPNVSNYQEFKNALQHDKSFERMIQSMTVERITGGSNFGKYKY